MEEEEEEEEEEVEKEEEEECNTKNGPVPILNDTSDIYTSIIHFLFYWNSVQVYDFIRSKIST